MMGHFTKTINPRRKIGWNMIKGSEFSLDIFYLNPLRYSRKGVEKIVGYLSLWLRVETQDHHINLGVISI